MIFANDFERGDSLDDYLKHPYYKIKYKYVRILCFQYRVFKLFEHTIISHFMLRFQNSITCVFSINICQYSFVQLIS